MHGILHTHMNNMNNMNNNAPPTRGRWRKIYWTGWGSKTNGLHTKEEFLNIVHVQFIDHYYGRQKGDRFIPDGKIKGDDIEGWMELVGATWV